MSLHDNPEGESLLQWWTIPPMFLVDVGRVNLDDLIQAKPGHIIRGEWEEGPPVIALPPIPPKFYPIEDEL